MKGALVILVVLIITGTLLYIYELRYRSRIARKATPKSTDDAEDGKEESAAAEESVCCGLHLVCEKESLSPVDAEVDYYDDEELDRFRGRGDEEYSSEEIEEFRDVLMTLRGEDIAGWSRSITKRGINLPSEIREELLMLVRERRGIE